MINQATNKLFLGVRCLGGRVGLSKPPPHPTLSLLDVSNNSQTLFKSETNLTVGNELASQTLTLKENCKALPRV